MLNYALISLLLAALLSLALNNLPRGGVHGLRNGLALKPPMGWMNWERFTCQIDCVKYPHNCVNENLFRQMSSTMDLFGYREAGYTHIQIDDCWHEHERDTQTQQLVPNRTRFPSGIPSLAEHVHGLGLSLGMYGDCGEKTCAGYPAQLKPKSSGDKGGNYFELDARTLREWSVDSFKFDGCYIDPLEAESVCPQFARELNTNEHKTMLICEWPFYMMYAHAKPNFTLAAESCNTWRYYDDIEDSWWSILNTIDYTIKHQSTIVKYHGPGHWFDPDQLVIGNFGLSVEQEKAQMAMWSIWSAPMFMSNDLRRIRDTSANILKNRNLIRVNQDKFGVLGMMTQQSSERDLQAFVKPVAPIKNGCPSFAIVYLNRRTLGGRVEVSFKLRDLLIKAPFSQAAKNLQELREVAPGELQPNEDIDSNKCLARLKSAMTKPIGSHNSILPSEQTKMAQSQVHFQMLDLIEDEDLGRIGLSENLILRVPPSGVRAIRLEEIDNTGQSSSSAASISSSS